MIRFLSLLCLTGAVTASPKTMHVKSTEGGLHRDHKNICHNSRCLSEKIGTSDGKEGYQPDARLNIKIKKEQTTKEKSDQKDLKPPMDPALAKITIENEEGKNVSLALRLSTEKKPMLLIVWATWCNPCIAEMPSVAKLHAKSHKTLDILTICVDGATSAKEAKAALLSKLGESKLDLPIFYSKNFSNALNLTAYPCAFLFSADGVLLESTIGALAWDGESGAQFLKKIETKKLITVKKCKTTSLKEKNKYKK